MADPKPDPKWEEFEGSEEDTAARGDDVPPIDFNTFVLSLSTSALLHLGERLGDEGGEAEGQAEPRKPNLVLARQSIDILGILEQKTRGNLDGEEERLLQQILFDLRMRYVAKARAANDDPTNPG